MLKRYQITVPLFLAIMLALLTSVPAPVARRTEIWQPNSCDSCILAPVRHVVQYLPCGLSQA